MFYNVTTSFISTFTSPVVQAKHQLPCLFVPRLLRHSKKIHKWYNFLFRFLPVRNVQCHLSKNYYRKFHSNGKRSRSLRCSFTRHKRHVISMKSITLTSYTRTTRTSRIFNFSTRASEEYWTCLNILAARRTRHIRRQTGRYFEREKMLLRNFQHFDTSNRFIYILN